jgi:hypothetical protein
MNASAGGTSRESVSGFIGMGRELSLSICIDTTEISVEFIGASSVSVIPGMLRRAASESVVEVRVPERGGGDDSGTLCCLVSIFTCMT